MNPIVNTRGETILLKLFGRPYTLEALQYGFVVASIFVSMTLWFGCYNKVLTGDKFTCLFSNIMPSLSLLLVMILRMIPNLLKKANQIISVRGSIGKGIEETATRKEKMLSGVTVLSVLTSWALEGSVVTGDSMRARGYGVTKRTSFMVFRMTEADWLLTAYLFATACGTIIFSMKGNVMISFVTYFGYLLIPIILNVKEMIQWSISRYRI